MHIPIQTQSDAENVMLNTPSSTYLRHWSKLYSSMPHLAGDLTHASRIRDLWSSYGIPTSLVRYDVLQNIPLSSSLTLSSPNGSPIYHASLVEPFVASDPTSRPENGLPAFHGFSRSGSVSAPIVYANFGRLADFMRLKAAGIDVKDKIVLCKYSRIFRGLKVRAAEQFGAIGVLIYSDPQEDGEFTEENGYAPYPDGPARHPESIQRGSVDFFSIAVGDPTTPGYPSLPGKETQRKSPHGAIPRIPSLPISYMDALPFLKALNGRGLGPTKMGEDWKGGLKGIDYSTGPSILKADLSIENEYKYSPIYNVIGTITGSGKEMIVLGNHHDSWCCGAIDPVSGSAAINEVARGLGSLLSMGWKPERTLVIASWDNEEYGLVGSTEWGEEHAELLSKRCIAYINVDGATNGGDFLSASGSPLLGHSIRSAAKLVPSPITENTVYDDWLSFHQSTSPSLCSPSSAQPPLEVLGTGSDYTVFFDHLGIPSIDIAFRKRSNAVYPYHSNYDSYFWVSTFGDPGFNKHLAMARLFGVFAVRLAGTRIVDFEAAEYPRDLARHLEGLKKEFPDIRRLELGELEDRIVGLRVASERLDNKARNLRELIEKEDEWIRGAALTGRLEDVNEKYMAIERAFLTKECGLPGRPWFKHIIFAPGLWKGYEGVVFPGLTEALENKELEEAKRWVGIIATAIHHLAETL